MVYVHSKYGGGQVKISELRKILNYSPGGIYSALETSEYFDVQGNEIRLTEKGQRYVKHKWIPYFSAFNPVSYFIILVGVIFFSGWYLRTYSGTILVFDWYAGLSLIIGGLILRFGLLRIYFWIMKIMKGT